MATRDSVLVTGGTGSVGRALVHSFSRAGYEVTFQYCHDKNEARRLMKKPRTLGVQLDFTEQWQLPSAQFDILINNAGINMGNVVTHRVRDEDWYCTLQINLSVPFLLVKQCLPWMKKKRWGRIINISSIYGLRAVEGYSPYTAAKHGLSGLTKTVAKEYGRFGVTANEICPGPIDSDMVREIAARKGISGPRAVTRYLKSIADEVPVGRLAMPEEVAHLALFLASENAAYISGASLALDGGLIA